MRGLAQYAMTGRRQAIIIVLLCGFFPLLNFISVSVVGLITLRRGMREGSLILLWAALPAVFFWAAGSNTLMILDISVFGLALLLRRDGSWATAILAGMAIGLAVQVSLLWQTEYVARLTLETGNSIRQLEAVGVSINLPPQQVVAEMLAIHGAYHALAVILCLMLARWWQAALYNPGGFRQEFHRLRIDPRIMVILLGLLIAGLMDIPPVDRIVSLVCIAPMFSGLAVIHWIVAKKNLGGAWLVICYVTLLLMAPVIILLGMSDSLLDYRKRLQAQDR